MRVSYESFLEPQSNIDYDETLLNAASRMGFGETLRFWESPSYFVVLGRSNQPEEEVNIEACLKDDIPVLKRCSGGGTVLQGPGCLNYALILKIKPGPLSSITQTNEWIMKKNAQALQPLFPDDKIEVKGYTDLAINQLKFSGNAQRRLQDFVLFHGTILYNFELNLVSKYLKFPSKQPDYRLGRSHGNFVRNLVVKPQEVMDQLIQFWAPHI